MGEDDDDWIPESDSDPNMRAKPNAMSTEQLVEIFSAVPQGAPPDFMELEKEVSDMNHDIVKSFTEHIRRVVRVCCTDVLVPGLHPQNLEEDVVHIHTPHSPLQRDRQAWSTRRRNRYRCGRR